MEQRIIKFRAWATKANKMVDLKSVTPLALDVGVLDEGDGLFLPFRDDIILMQFTGLKDKGGVEIYESDIVKDVSRIEGLQNLLVFWSDNCAAWMIRNSRRTWSENIAWQNEGLEVIGNIHQDGHLLEQ